MAALAHGGRADAPQEDDKDPGFGWVACTTDDILAHKPDLWDVLVTLPAHNLRHSVERKVYPTLKNSKGKIIRATQRDLRRWMTLRQSLAPHAGGYARPRSSSTARTTGSPSPFTLASSQILGREAGKHGSHPSSSSAPNLIDTRAEAESPLDDSIANTPSLGDNPDVVVEPQTWTALAYTSFFWWASAGEERTDLDEEAAHDAEMMVDFAPDPILSKSGIDDDNEVAVEDEDGNDHGNHETHNTALDTGLEVSVLQYFHRLSSLLFTSLANIVESVDEEDEDERISPANERYRDEPSEGQGHAEEDASLLPNRTTTDGDDLGIINITQDDLTSLGLDSYSTMDKDFVKEMIALYWGREAEMARGRWTSGDGDGWELCGLRIC